SNQFFASAVLTLSFPMDLSRLQQVLNRAPSMRITVIGDLMLDEFVWGKVGRISPEAPVPVVEVTGESFYPGVAANVARNLRGLWQRLCNDRASFRNCARGARGR